MYHMRFLSHLNNPLLNHHHYHNTIHIPKILYINKKFILYIIIHLIICDNIFLKYIIKKKYIIFNMVVNAASRLYDPNIKTNIVFKEINSFVLLIISLLILLENQY